MKRYDEKVLGLLLDKYENSLLYTGENRRNQSISIRIEKKTFPEYFDESSGEYAVLHAQLQELEQAGLVRLDWKNKKTGHILERCILVTESTAQIYARLHRLPRREKEERILDICDRYQGRHQTLDSFLLFIRERIETRESISQYASLDEPEELAGRCELVLHILENEEEIFLREFSIRFCNDSKAAEKEIAGAAGIISRFSKEKGLQLLNAEQVLEEFGVFKNPSWLMVKGCGRILLRGQGKETPGTGIQGKETQGIRAQDQKTQDLKFQCLESWNMEMQTLEAHTRNAVLLQQIDLSLLQDGIGLSSRDIDFVEWEQDCPPKRVITIENLTSFHRWEEEGTLAVYLGGYHNRAKRNFLKRLYQAFPGASYAHFGDIDCGGFLIWKDLCEKTGISFIPRYMDEETFIRCLDCEKELTEHDRRELKKMCREPFFKEQRNLFTLMLKKGRKLEQECIRKI